MEVRLDRKRRGTVATRHRIAVSLCGGGGGGGGGGAIAARGVAFHMPWGRGGGGNCCQRGGISYAMGEGGGGGSWPPPPLPHPTPKAMLDLGLHGIYLDLS